MSAGAGTIVASDQRADQVEDEMKTLAEIRNALREHQEELLQKHKVRVVGIFGSYAREEHKRGSDLDLLAEFDEPASLLKLVGAEIYLSKVLGVKVDLIPRQDVRPELRERIRREAINP
jgi:predicted nucleotidyltransferase